MALSYTQITATFEDAEGNPLSGSAEFTVNVALYESGVPVLIPGVGVEAQIVNGTLKNMSGGTFQLVDLASTGLVIEGSQTGFWYYTVAITIDGQVIAPWSFFLEHSSTPVDLFALANTPPGGAGVLSVTAGDASVVVGGTATAPTVESGTLDKIAQLHPAAAAVGFNGQKATGLANGSAAADAVAYGQLGTAAFQSTAAFDAAGAASTAQANAESYANSTFVPLSEVGAAAGVAPLDSSSPTPLLPKNRLPNVLRSDYKFAPEDYLGRGDTIIVSDAAMNSGSPNLACTTSTPFTSTAVDGGKKVYVVGAGASGADYRSTITSVTDSGHAVCAANAGTNVTGAGCSFGTDNTTPIGQALTAAMTFGASSSREACLIFSESGYGVAGAPAVGGSTLGNALFPFSPVTATIRKQRLRLLAPYADPAALIHWQQTTPQMNGPAIVVLSAPVAVDATYGPPSVFGGPFAGYGAASSLFSNMQVVVDGLSVLAPWDCGYMAFDFLGLAEAVVVSGSKLAMATVPSGTGWPQITQFGSLTRTTAGLRMPDTNNNDRSDITWWSSEGDIYALMPSEHTTFDSVRAIYCFVACRPYSGSAMAHGLYGRHLSAENCTYAVSPMPSGVPGFPGGNIVKFVIDRVDVETVTDVLSDPGNLALGRIGATGNWTPAYGNISVNGGPDVRVTELMQAPGPISSPHAAPGSGSTWANSYYTPLWVRATLTGGTFSAFTIDGVSQPDAIGTSSYSFPLAEGDVYTPTYTGTLAHTLRAV